MKIIALVDPKCQRSFVRHRTELLPAKVGAAIAQSGDFRYHFGVNHADGPNSSNFFHLFDLIRGLFDVVRQPGLPACTFALPFWLKAVSSRVAENAIVVAGSLESLSFAAFAAFAFFSLCFRLIAF